MKQGHGEEDRTDVRRVLASSSSHTRWKSTSWSTLGISNNVFTQSSKGSGAKCRVQALTFRKNREAFRFLHVSSSSTTGFTPESWKLGLPKNVFTVICTTSQYVAGILTVTFTFTLPSHHVLH